MADAVLELLAELEDNASPELENMTGAVDRLGKQADKTQSGPLKRLTAAIGPGIRTAAKVGVAAIATITVAAGATVAKGLSEFAGFQEGMNEVFTLLPDISGEAMAMMRGQVTDFAVDFRVLPEEVVPALYQSLSAGVPPDNVFSFLETAQKAAKGGVTELETAVDGISSVVNAYGEDIITATEASDEMFTAVRLGKTTFEELSDALFNVNPVAAALGVDFGEVAAALAATTAQGVPTRVATTQLRQALVELSKEGGQTSELFQELSGKSFRDFIASGGTVQEALQLMEDHAADTGVGVNDLFTSVEAGNAALAITGRGTEAFSNALAEMEDSAGATQAAYDRMDTGLNRIRDTLRVVANVVLIEIGERAAPIIERFGTWIAENLPALVEQGFAALDAGIAVFTTLSQYIGFVVDEGDVLNDFLANLPPNLQPVALAIGRIVNAITSAVGAFQYFISEGFTPAQAAVLALGDLLDNFISEDSPFFTFMWASIEALAELVGWVQNLITRYVSWKDILTVVGVAVAAVVLPALLSLIVTIAQVVAIVGGAIAIVAALRNAWESDWSGIRSATTAAWQNSIKPALQAIWAFIQDPLLPMLGRLASWYMTTAVEAFGALQNAWDTILRPALQAIWAFIEDPLIPTLGRMATWLNENIPAAIDVLLAIWDTMRGAFRAVWTFITGDLIPMWQAWEDAQDALGEFIGAWVHYIWEQKLEPALRGIFNWLDEHVMPALNRLSELMGTNVTDESAKAGEALEVVQEILGFLGEAISDFIDEKLESWRSGFEDIRGVISTVTDFLGGLADAIRNLPKPPGWAMPGSLPPLAQGFMDIATTAGSLADTIARRLFPVIDELGQKIHAGEIEETFQKLGVITGLGGAAAGFLQSQTLDPLTSELDEVAARIEEIDDILASGDVDMWQFIALNSERQRLLQQRAGLTEQIAEAEQKILEFQQAQQRLNFLQQQVKLLELIQSEGLDPQQILGGLELGVDADPGAILETMTRVVEMIIANTEEQLGIASESKVFRAIGENVIAGLLAPFDTAANQAGNVISAFTNSVIPSPVVNMPAGGPAVNQSTTNQTTWNVHYHTQTIPQRRLLQDVQTLQMLGP